jgi:hypothetical protein
VALPTSGTIKIAHGASFAEYLEELAAEIESLRRDAERHKKDT